MGWEVGGRFKREGTYIYLSQVTPVVKNLTANAEDVRYTSSIPGSETSPREGMATYSSILAWRILWTEVPGQPQPVSLQRVGQD